MLVQEATSFVHGYAQKQAPRYGMTFHEAEDIAQDVLEKAYERLPLSHGYLARCVHNKMIDWCRSHKEEPCEIEVSTPRTLVEEEVEYRELERTLCKAIDGLTEAYRQVMWLRLAGKKKWEIAEILRVPTGTVGSRVDYAKGRLRRHLH